MAFLSRVGALLKHNVGKHITSASSASKSPSLFQVIRCMSMISNTKLFVGGLHYNTSQETLREHFSRYGDVDFVKIITDRETGTSRGFGFITFLSPEAASSAIQGVDGQELDGRRLRVNYATEKPRGGDFGGGWQGVSNYSGGGYQGGNYPGGGSGDQGGGYASGGYGGNNYSGGGGYEGGNYSGGGDGGNYGGDGGNYGGDGGWGGSGNQRRGGSDFSSGSGNYANGGGEFSSAGSNFSVGGSGFSSGGGGGDGGDDEFSSGSSGGNYASGGASYVRGGEGGGSHSSSLPNFGSISNDNQSGPYGGNEDFGGHDVDENRRDKDDVANMK